MGRRRIRIQPEQKSLHSNSFEFITSKDGELLKIGNTMDPCRIDIEIPGVVSASSELYAALMESLGYAKTLADVDVPYISSKLCDVMELHLQEAISRTATPRMHLQILKVNSKTKWKKAESNKKK